MGWRNMHHTELPHHKGSQKMSAEVSTVEEKYLKPICSSCVHFNRNPPPDLSVLPTIWSDMCRNWCKKGNDCNGRYDIRDCHVSKHKDQKR